jgi:hypothetical protein
MAFELLFNTRLTLPRFGHLQRTPICVLIFPKGMDFFFAREELKPDRRKEKSSLKLKFL